MTNFCSLLTIDAGLYMPNYKAINIYFMKAVVAGQKKAVKTADVKYLYCP